MSNRDEGIRNLIPGFRSADEIKEDQTTKKYIDTVLSQRDPVLDMDPLETFLRASPTINLKPTPKEETKEPPMNLDQILKDQAKGRERIRKARQNPQWVEEHNKRFGSISKTTVLPKDKTVAQLQTLKNWGLEKPKAKAEASKGNYVPWYDRMAQEEAEKLNRIKKMAWEESQVKSAEPKKLTAQDIKNVYDKK